jgi:hypothetical protein
MIGGDEPFCPIFLILGKPDVYDIPGYGIVDEQDLAVYAGQGFALGGIILYQNLLKYYILIFFTHGAKV